MDDFLWGLKMTGVGMGTVFALLALLMAVLTLIGRLDRAAEPVLDEVEEPEALPAAEVPEQPEAGRVEFLTDGLTVDQAAAIALAVVTHAQVRRQQAAPEARTHAPGSQIHTSRWVAVGRGAQNSSWNRR